VARLARSRREAEPWLRDDVQANRITSADWGENHPGFCYEFGDPNAEPFIPTEVLEATLLQQRFFIAVWQEHEITTIDVSHDPSRTFNARRLMGPPTERDWCDIIRYEIDEETGVKYRNPRAVCIDEFIDPREVLFHLAQVLRLPLGYPLGDQEQSLLALQEPIQRILVEFPHAVETGPFPLDTCITALGSLAHKEYQSTIYGSDTV